MILLTEDLEKRYRTYSNIKTKVAREVKSGALIKLKKGVYTDDATVPGYVFCSAIYSPSYVSFETALAIHGLSPVKTGFFYSATKKKNKHKNFVNDLGEFIYQDVPDEVFNQSVFYYKEEGFLILVASKEKAVCDTLYKADTITSIKALKGYIFGEIGVNEDLFWGLNLHQILMLCPLYKCRTINTLERMIRKHLGLPQTQKKPKKNASKDKAQEAWNALAAFRNKYQEG